jgi:tungstate transport system ATP-binding protein
MNLYEIHNLAQCYDGQPVLAIQRWAIPTGSIVGLAGPNGSGKSTLLRLLGFVERPSDGEISFEGRKTDIHASGLRTHVTLLPQQSYLLKRSVYHNLVYGLRLRKDRRHERQRVYDALNWVGLEPGRFAQRPWFALSGGEARRVSLAARLILQPRVFLLDEPTTSVDAASAHMIKESVIRAKQQWNTTLIISSHDMEWLNDICDHMLHLFRGKVMEGGQPTIIFGPWRKDKNGTVSHILTDGERIVAAGPPADPVNAVAVMDAHQMLLTNDSSKIPEGLYRLKGTLIRLSLEKATQGIGAMVAVASLTFHVSLRWENVDGISLRPGQMVWVGYDPTRVQWMV